jgi:hypothetical protein
MVEQDHEFERRFNSRQMVMEEWKNAGMSPECVKREFGWGLMKRARSLGYAFRGVPSISEVPTGEDQFIGIYVDKEYILAFLEYTGAEDKRKDIERAFKEGQRGSR